MGRGVDQGGDACKGGDSRSLAVSVTSTISTISTAVSTVATISTVGFSGGTCHNNSEYELKKDMVVTKLVFLLVTKILLNLKNCKDDYNSVQLF